MKIEKEVNNKLTKNTNNIKIIYKYTHDIIV